MSKALCQNLLLGLFVKFQVILPYLSFLPPLDNDSLSNGERKTPLSEAQLRTSQRVSYPLLRFENKYTKNICTASIHYPLYLSNTGFWPIWGDLVDNKKGPEIGSFLLRFKRIYYFLSDISLLTFSINREAAS